MILALLGTALAEPCPKAEQVFPLTIAFDRDLITSEDVEKTVNEVKLAVAANSALTVEIQVHADANGSSAWNQKLTEQRASAVRSLLADHGLEAIARGCGETTPLGGPIEADSRVELHLVQP
ncbi:MAG: OmpA family protein [Proteobacteria bacterium]|nr:OmpA family protein [Pseudomonadota bacterium]MCP4916779.1 OmpA family protein [Pseudomonadota bacterium]